MKNLSWTKMHRMNLVAIIGTRQATKEQISYVKKYIAGLDDSVTVISGCAHGIDTVALIAARERGLETIGCVPRTTYNKSIQRYCDHLLDLSKVSGRLREEAFDFAKVCHPMKWINGAPLLFHARNYLIIRNAKKVVVFPSTKKTSSGGIWQGIRVAQAIGVPLLVIDEEGNKVVELYSYLRKG